MKISIIGTSKITEAHIRTIQKNKSNTEQSYWMFAIIIKGNKSYKKICNYLISNNIDFYTGVPDSLLKEFCFCIDDNVSENTHIIAPNEGNAVALAAGYHLGTGKLPLVYMQNSGIGNAINPLLSLCDPEVYSIPMIIFIGWRGEPGVKDEPQHIKQGKIQLDLIKSMDIAFSIISKDESVVYNDQIAFYSRLYG